MYGVFGKFLLLKTSINFGGHGTELTIVVLDYILEIQTEVS